MAILDDYQNVVRDYADWSAIEDRVDITVFHDTIHDPDRLAERLAPYEILLTNRERTPFPAKLIERLPNLRLLATTGMHNHAIDTNFARDRGIFVCGTQSDTDSTAELTWGMIFALTRNLCVEDANMRAGGWQSTVGFGYAMLVYVALSAPSGRTVSFSYTTANGTATAGSDYVANSGTLTFSARP